MELLLTLNIAHCEKKIKDILTELLVAFSRDLDKTRLEASFKTPYTKFQNDVTQAAPTSKRFSAQSKVKCLRVLKSIMRSYQRHPADFQSVVPGICSFLAKGFNLEFDTKSSYLAELCELIEVFVELFCDFYR